MAWNFRRRIKVAPGVHVNLSKGGVSTSVGPRGAKITMGRNGTYINTGIPGIGMYNRQKIGGSSYNNYASNRRNNGCGGIVCVWLLLLIFGLGTFIAISNGEEIGAIISAITAAVSLIIIIAHYINSHEEKKRLIAEQKEAEMQRLEEERIAALPNYFDAKINEEFFNETMKSISSITDFLHYLITVDFYDWMDKQNLPLVRNTNSYQLIRFMILSDIKTAFLAMGSSTDFKSKEGLALFLVTNAINSNEDVDFGMLNHISDETIKPTTDLLDGSFNVFNKESDPQKLVFADLIYDFDKDAKLQYLIVLYRFLSVAAKADDIVTEKESNYLKHLLTYAHKIDSNVNIDIDMVATIDVRIELGDSLTVGQYVVREQKCVISDIQAGLGISRNRILSAIKDLENAGVIQTVGTKRKVLISREGDVIRLLRGQKALGNCENVEVTDSIERPIADNSKISDANANDITNKKKVINNQSTITLESLIGLDSVKKEVQTLTNFVKIQQKRAEQGLKSSSVSYHCVFTGNPGTGKTTVARIVADIYKNLGVLKKGHLVETDRAGLVAEYVGQTAVKTNKIIDSALDGVLFIDEAYSLVGGGESDYGKEAIATLLKRMEDDRARLVVILAGYTKDMKQFIDSNPGLQSRFNRYIEFPDYTADELYQIFALNLKKYDYHVTDEAKDALQRFFENAVDNKDANFCNGRFVRNIFEKVLERQANRLAAIPNLTAEQLSEISIEDLPNKL